jgi:hypothetical protein
MEPPGSIILSLRNVVPVEGPRPTMQIFLAIEFSKTSRARGHPCALFLYAHYVRQGLYTLSSWKRSKPMDCIRLGAFRGVSVYTALRACIHTTLSYSYFAFYLHAFPQDSFTSHFRHLCFYATDWLRFATTHAFIGMTSPPSVDVHSVNSCGENLNKTSQENPCLQTEVK